MINVLFVCLGNICRSPMADGVFRHLVGQAKLNEVIRVDSAGTAAYHVGESAHPGTLKVLRKNGIVYNGRARQFDADDLKTFEYVLAMDRSNYTNVLRLEGITPHAGMTCHTLERGTEVALFLHYAHEAGTVDVLEVPDPYYDGRFDAVYALVKAGAEALLTHIREKESV